MTGIAPARAARAEYGETPSLRPKAARGRARPAPSWSSCTPDRTCGRLLQAGAATVVLLDPRGEMTGATAWQETPRQPKRAPVDWAEGPCGDCLRTGVPVPQTALDGPVATARWPRFSTWAIQRGFGAVAAQPLRRRAQTIGALTLLARPGLLRDADLRLGQALADAATIGILQHRAVHDQRTLAAQLQTALDSRIVIEQAKGVLAERTGVSMDDAFARLRCHARSTRTRLTVLAGQVIDGSADPDL